MIANFLNSNIFVILYTYKGNKQIKGKENILKLQAYDAEKKLVTKSQRKSLSVRVVCMSYIVMHGMCLVGKVPKFWNFKQILEFKTFIKAS